MPFPRKISDEQRALLREIALTRRYIADIYRTLPSNKQLAREMGGVSRSAIEQIMVQELAAYDAEQSGMLRSDLVSRETNHGENAAIWPPASMDNTQSVSAKESN